MVSLRELQDPDQTFFWQDMVFVPTVEITDLALKYNVWAPVVRDFARQRRIDISDGTMPLSSASVFGAAMFILGKWGIRADQLGKRYPLADIIAASFKIRAKNYHGVVFYSRVDLAKYFRAKKSVAKLKPKRKSKPRLGPVLISEPKKQILETKQALKLTESVAPKTKLIKPSPAKIAVEKATESIHDDRLITLTEAAELLRVRMSSLWKWVMVDKIIPYLDTPQGNKIRLVDVLSLKELPFFQQKQYGYTEIGKICGGVSRQTVRKWVLDGKIQSTTAPGGQKYIPAEFLPICRKLAKHAKRMNHRNPG